MDEIVKPGFACKESISDAVFRINQEINSNCFLPHCLGAVGNYEGFPLSGIASCVCRWHDRLTFANRDSRQLVRAGTDGNVIIRAGQSAQSAKNSKEES